MLLRTLITLVFLIGAAAQAVAEGWELQRADGSVRISVDGKTWSRAQDGMALASGTWIRTGARGRAIVGRGAERIIYRANTLAAISVSEPTGQTTQVTHQRGSVFLSVITKQRKRTSVVTPHLAAVIKGTVLEVTTDQQRASVRVDKGVVEVRSDGRSVDVEAGREAVSDGQSLSVAAADVTSQVPGAPNTFSTELRAAPTSNRQNNASATGLANGNAFGASGAVNNGVGNGNGGGNGNGNNGNGNGNGGGNGNGNGNNGNGNGNNGNGNGNGGANGNGNNGNGNGNGGGNGNGNNGNGNGNGGEN